MSSNYQEVPSDDSVPHIPGLQSKRSRFSNTSFQITIIVVSLVILSLMIFLVVYFASPGKKDLAAVYSQQIAALISPDQCNDHLYKLTRKPHMAGTKESNELATFVQNEFKKYGIDDVKLERYDVLLSYPTTGNVLELIDTNTGTTKQLDLYEPAVPGDETSIVDKKLVPPFNAYSGSGDVTGDFVYANYGTYEDFKYLDDNGISVADKIVIVRYGKVFRGLKTQFAEQRNAKAILIYSDPADDGIKKGSVYPNGPWRPESGVQRGSVQYLQNAPGDPLTPGTPSLPGTKIKIPRDQATNVPSKILALPIGYKNAKEIMQHLRGPDAPEDWVGGIDGITYRIGGDGNNDKELRVKVSMNETVTPIYNVIAKIEGAEEPDRMIIIGNHRDAWVYGAVDPHTGTISLLEIARALGHLLKTGWRPRRTIVLASWDAEEFGLIGSTEWVEHFQDILKRQAVAYINLDNYSGHKFSAASAPSLATLLREETKKVPSSDKPGKTLFDNWSENLGTKEPTPDYVGAGSDYTAFFHFLGVPIINLHSRGDYGVYHSLYDSYTYVTKFTDPKFNICKTIGTIWGSLVMRLAHDEILPFNHAETASYLMTHYNQLLSNKYIKQFLDEITEEQEATFTKALANIKSALDALTEAAKKLTTEIEHAKNLRLDRELKIRELNDKLMSVEKGFINPQGLEGRNWYKHMMVAPTNGYGYEVFPGILESVRMGKQGYDRALKSIEQIVFSIRQAVAILSNVL